MYFKRLEIFGFKSFADKTSLEFQPGITSIVGPNGCGKSNVFDAIRWVLGEQSAKDLRGESMGDVIFAGTDKRPALGFAEVSVTFSNESKMLPIDYEEVTVTRRLFRSGESEYLLNKNTCRLKDIVELFLGTGIGAEAYSMVQQGRVDLIVSAKPEDRRQIFDEAAGITKYKSKKKEALSKLKETEENLLRINDIVVEVKRQIASIERQAKKAQRYKEEFEQLKSFELIMAQYHMSRFKVDLDAIQQQGSTLAEKENNATRQLQQLNERLEEETALVQELDEEINALRARQMNLEHDIDSNSRQIVFNEERLSTIDATCQRLESDKSAALERCKVNQAKIEEINVQLQALQQSTQVLAQDLQSKKDALSVLVHAIEEAQQSIQLYVHEQASLHAEEVRIKNQVTDLTKKYLGLQASQSRLQQENAKISTEKTQISQKGEAVTIAINTVNLQVQEAWSELVDVRRNLEEAQLNLSAQEGKIDELEKNKVFLISQKEFITRMQDQYQGIPDPVVEGKFICQVRPSEKQTGIIGKVKDIREVADENGGVQYEIVYETKFIALDLAHMDERLILLDEQLFDAAASRDALDGELAGAQASVEVVLKKIQELEKKLGVLEAQKNDIELETGKIIGELDMIHTESSQIESDLAGIKVQEQTLSDSLVGISGQITRCQEDVKAKQSAVVEKNREREEFNVGIVQLEAQLQAAFQSQRGLEENTAIYTHSLDRDLSDVGRFDSQFNELQSKKIAVNEDSLRLEGLISDAKAQLSAVSGEVEDTVARKQEMSLRLGSLRQEARGFEEEIINAKTERHNLDMRSQEIVFAERSLKERLMQAYRIDIDALPEPQAAIAAPPAAFDQTTPPEAQGQDMAIPVQEEHVTVPQAQEPAPQVNFDELGLEIERLKKRCEAYGAVNLVAIEEFEELKQRYEFLTKQQSDLLTAREALMQTIQKINRTTRQMFTDTFTKVNEEFRIYFRMLFGGGEAELILLDPENALECGIDIVARPPGKKPQHISLLSGGEKTLTAIALIFGVFKVNPSPFCVLDEIDAALDESNVGRFANVLKEFAKIAQFIVITHNKRTMENADILYGVTMPERGISRIVSVRFNQNAPSPAVLPAASEPAPAGV